MQERDELVMSNKLSVEKVTRDMNEKVRKVSFTNTCIQTFTCTRALNYCIRNVRQVGTCSIIPIMIESYVSLEWKFHVISSLVVRDQCW